MRNRAKCRLCKDIIESFTLMDYITCKCGEIAICGGDTKLETYAHDYKNFLRVDDDGNEILVEYQVNALMPTPEQRLTYDDLLDMLDKMADGIERMPDNMKYGAPTNADLYSLIVLVSNILRMKA